MDQLTPIVIPLSCEISALQEDPHSRILVSSSPYQRNGAGIPKATRT